MILLNRSRWANQPTELVELDFTHPLVDRLVLAVVPGISTHEYISGTLFNNIGGFASVTSRNGVRGMDNSSKTDGGFSCGLPAEMANITSEFSLVTRVEVDDWDSSGHIFCLPDQESSWNTPYERFSLHRDSLNDEVRLAFVDGPGNVNTMDWPFAPEPGLGDQGIQTLALGWKQSSNLYFYKNRANTFVSATNGDNGTPLASGSGSASHVAFLQRSKNVPFEGIDGWMEYFFLFDRYVGSEILREFAMFPYQMFRPRTNRRVYMPAVVGPQTIVATAHTLTADFGSASIAGALGTSTPFVQKFHEPNKISGSGATYNLPQLFSFSRNSVAYDIDDLNQIKQYGLNTPVRNLDGMRHEPASTNYIPNSDGVGAQVGTDSGSTYPTDASWPTEAGSGPWNTTYENQTFTTELLLSGQNNVLIKNCTFNVNTGTDNAIEMVNCNNIRIEGCDIYSGSRNGIYVYQNNTDVVIVNNYFHDIKQTGILTSRPNTNLKILGNRFHNMGTGGDQQVGGIVDYHGIYIQCYDALVDKNYLTDCLDGNGISFRTAGIARRNFVNGTGKAGIDYYSDHPSGGSNTLLFEDNVIANDSGFQARACIDVLLAGSSIGNLIDTVIVRNNTITDAVDIDQEIYDNCTVTVTNNAIVGTQTAVDLMAGWGSGGTSVLPTGWSFTKNQAFPQLEISATGTENGCPYVEFNFDETNNETERDLYINFIGDTVQAASNGQTWIGSVFLKPISRMSHIPRIQVVERDAQGNFLGSQESLGTEGNYVYHGNVTRLVIQRTLSNSATAFVQLRLRFNVASGVYFRSQFRLYIPQLENNQYASSGIRTSGTIASRSASELYVHLNPGTYTNIYEEWLDERTGTFVKDTRNSPVVGESNYVVPTKHGFRLQRFSLDTALATPTLVTTNPSVDIPARNSGDVIYVAPGYYNVGNITVPSGVTVVGTVSTVFEGSGYLGTWSFNGTHYTMAGAAIGWNNQPESGWISQPYSANRIDLHLDSVYIPQKTTLDAVGAGECFINSSGTIYYEPNGDNPNKKDSRVSVIDGPCFTGDAGNNKTFRNLRVNRYSTNGQRGGFTSFGNDSGSTLGTGNRIEYCYMKQHHSCSISMGHDTTVSKSWVIDSGGVGLHCGRDPNVIVDTILVDGCYFTGSNKRTFQTEQDAGEIKFSNCRDVTISNSELSYALGRGVWFDWNCWNTSVYNCYIHHNSRSGYNAEGVGGNTNEWHKIRYCVLHDNNTDLTTSEKLIWGADILYNGSAYAWIENNQVTSNWGPAWTFTGRAGSLYTEEEIFVHDNEFIMLDNSSAGNGFGLSNAETATYQLWYNTLDVDFNTYRGADNSYVKWEWVNSSGAYVGVSYPTLPSNGEANSTFDIAANPGSHTIYGFMLNNQEAQVSGFILSMTFGTPLLLSTAQVVSANGLNLPTTFGTPFVITPGTLIANSLPLSLNFGAANLGSTTPIVTPVSLVLSLGFGNPTEESDLLVNGDGTGNELELVFGTNITIIAPQAGDFKTTYLDVLPNRRDV